MRTLLAALAVIISMSAWSALAEPGKVISVMAERTSSAGKEQTSIQITETEAIFAANSDFLQGTGSKVRLGLFGSELTDGLRKAAQELRKIEAEAGSKEKPGKPSGYVSPHSIRLYVGSTPVPFDSPAYRELMSILRDPSRLAAWKPRDAVEVTRTGGAARFSAKPLAGGREAKVDCASRSELKICEVRPYGLVHLEDKSR